MACSSCGGTGVIRIARAPSSQPEGGPIVIRQKQAIINLTKTSTPAAPRAFKGVRSARDVDKYRDHK